MVASSKIILVGLLIGAVTFASGDDRNALTKGETRRLSGAFIRRRRPATIGEGGRTPPYAVSMEPLIKYSQRDPLYDELSINKSTTQDISSRGDYLSAGSNNLAEVTAGPRLDQYGPPQYGPPQYGPPQYYQEPEPIIEIIIKESNESLPAPTQAPTPPPPPATREPIQVFYVKYKKNPGAGYGESDVVYEPPVPALTQHESDAVEPDPDPQYPPFQQETATEEPYLPPPPSTTLRTIIRPESETYHVPDGATSGLKVTFSSSSEHNDKSEHEPVESASEVEGRLPERQQRYQSQNIESIDITTPKPHYFKRQQGPYFPHPQNPQNLQGFTPPPPGQFQNGPPQGRQPFPSHTVQGTYNQGNQPPSQFRPQQAAATFQRPQQFNPNQNSVNQPANFQQRPPVRYSEPWQQGPNPNDYRARPPQQPNFEPQRRPQFQPTLEAQIEEYQRHKLYLHQQNLRQQSEQANQVQQQNFNRNPQPIQNQNVQYQPLQPIHVQSQPQGIPFQRGPPNFNRQQFSSHQSREPALNSAISQNLVTPQPVASFTSSNPVVAADNSKPFVPSPQHNPPQDQQVITQPSQASFSQPDVQTSNPGINYSGRNTGFVRPQLIFNDHEFVKTISPIEDIDIKSDGESGNKVPGDEQEKTSTESSPEVSTDDRAHSALSALANHKIAPQAENHRYEQQLSSTTPPSPQPTYYSTTSVPNTSPNNAYSNQPSSTQSPEGYEGDKKEDETSEELQKKKANLAALPDEVPDDLREQLLASGILGNADIQILDYDKVGDIPIESLPPEALENLYGAGSEQVATVVKPDGTPEKKSVEMKVVHFDPNTKEGQGLADTYLREDATQLDPVVLNDSRYNRYLPLKIKGTNFPLPDIPQLKNRTVNSVVVLAPVDYDFIKTQEDVDRASRTIQVEGVRFIAGDSLKTLVRNPSLSNYNKWLDVEKETPSGKQSVVLLVTSPTSTEESSSKMEIFMYDVATTKVSRLRGELSSTFVEVAESNSGSEELEELAGAASGETTQSTR